jgi:thiamine-phosphate diphosphorylase
LSRRPVPPLHVVTDHAVAARPGFTERAKRVMEAGGDRVAFHVRLPAASGRAAYDLAAALAPVARSTGALLIVNDRVDVAASVAADGAHLGRRSIAPADARRILGADRLIGSSVTTAEEATDAARGGSDYLFVGSIYATASHPGREGIGVDGVAALTSVGIPLIAIGGITVDRVPLVRSAGAAGVAVIRAVWDADGPADAVRGFLDALG